MSTESPYVTLISHDNYSFIVSRTAACRSATIKRMLNEEHRFSEAQSGVCTFPEISGVVLAKICEYFYFAEKNRDVPSVPDPDIPAELCLELLMAADFLEV